MRSGVAVLGGMGARRRASTALLATTGDLMARLNMYREYPYLFVVMCARWFPATYQHAITLFLQQPYKNARHGIFIGIAEYGFGPR